MSKASQFKIYAEECASWARGAKTDAQRESLLKLARTWTLAASKEEANKKDDSVLPHQAARRNNDE